jgi:hypothetical protein
MSCQLTVSENALTVQKMPIIITLQELIFAGKGNVKTDLALTGGKIVNVNTK